MDFAQSGFPAGVSILLLLVTVVVVLLWRGRSGPLKKSPKDGAVGDDVELKRRLRKLNQVPARRETRGVYGTKIRDALRIVRDEEVEGLTIKESYGVNSRGVEIFSKSWIPEDGNPKAAICFCHGYGDTVTYFFEVIARKLASKQYAVFAMDYEGFGLSEGLHGYIPKFDEIVADVIEHYSSVTKKQEELKKIPHFLMGQSMGGAVALKTHLTMPSETWDGAILIAPLCKIADDMTPPRVVVEVLKLIAKVFPKAKLVPSKSIIDIGFREVEKREQARNNLIAYVDKPRLRTAVELLKATHEIEHKLQQVSLPLLIIHGAADRVTDPAVSQALYERASTKDKTIHLYEDSWHAVLEGESDEMIDTAIGDIVKWLDAHSTST